MPEKKILYVITKSVWGGAQRYVYDLAVNLPKDRFEVVVAAGGSGPLFQKLKNAGIRTTQIPALERDIHIYKELRSFWYLFLFFCKEKPDVIHLNSNKIGALGSLAAFLYRLLTLNQKLLTVFTVHGFGFLEPRPQWQKVLIFAATAFGTLFQRKIIVLNKREYHLACRFVPRKKLNLITLGIAPVQFVAKEEARAVLSQKVNTPLPHHMILVGTVAELTKNKGISFLIKAITKIPHEIRKKIKVITIGGGEDHALLEKEINKSNLKNIVFLIGFIPDAALLLKGFDIFVLPSLKEGLPYTVMEAMAAGLPVVATDIGGIPDLIETGKEGLLVPSRDSNALMHRIATLINDSGARTYFGVSGAKKIKERFLLSVMVEKTTALYG